MAESSDCGRIQFTMKNASLDFDPASFRDPSGSVFRGEDGVIYRSVNPVYESEYKLLFDSGLYEELSSTGRLVKHEEVSQSENGFGMVLRPQQISQISYPHEWSFSQFKDAALLTLDIQRRALQRGMTLKDASAYNIQFERGRPIFIDTLSFEKRVSGEPWVAYGQFCAHFVAPLALMAYSDIRLQRLMEIFIDGVPLDLAVRLLPFRTRLKPGLLWHIYIHSWMQRRYSDTSVKGHAGEKGRHSISETAAVAMIDGLIGLISGLSWKPAGTEWADYYETSSYDNEGIGHKRKIVHDVVTRVAPKTMWDLGANTGMFSMIAAESGTDVTAFDIDPACVEICYSEVKKRRIKNVLPLRMDLTNPSSAIGWANAERRSFIDRGPVDLVMMLALVHHLAISNNVPLAKIADFACSICRSLLIEFVPKSDPQVKRLLRSRRDIFSDYDRECFEAEFSRRFCLESSYPVGKDGRVLYLFRKHE